ncbi:MAG: response regulator transcription factor [Microcoleus sp. SIO2G3]|nr:response regulator transcription factor [Microcoleus sp. SIO2G3]
MNLLPELCSPNPTSHSTKSTLASSSISIVSNSYLLREAITLLLKSHQPTYLINSYAGDVNIVLTAINPSNHLVLIDSGMGDNATITHIQEWRSLQPSPYVVVLELKNDIELILDCIEAGAHGYALEGASSAEVIQIVEQVYQGTAQCSPEVTAKLFERLAQPKAMQQSQEKPLLTRRELEVLHCIAKNYSDREIAIELVIEVRTVKHHVHNILRKFKVKHRWQAAQVALENRWLEPTSS